MAEQITENLWKLDIPLVGNPLKNLNSYLILGGERSLLIDTGFNQAPCLEAMERQLDELNVDRTRMDIFMTHLHADHTGLAVRLIREGCRMFIGRTDAEWFLRTHTQDYWTNNYKSYMDNGFSDEEIEALRRHNPAQNGAAEGWARRSTPLDEGDELTYGGHTLRVIDTPGHTPGHVCLYEPDRHWLFSGDHVLFHISPNICRWTLVPDSLGDYLKSLDKIRDLPVDLLLPAHREETGVLAQRVDELRAHHARRLQNTIDVVTQTPGLNAWQIAGRMSWRIRSRNWDEFPTTQKYFAVGETLAHLDYLELRGRLRRRFSKGKYIYFPAQE